VERKRINSGTLRSVGYDARNRVLEVEFTNGAVIQYTGVGEDLHRGLMSASSAASYFKDRIEEDFPSRRSR
jgi:KTSC domain-containing protein